LTLLASGTFLIQMIHGRMLSWDVEADTSAILLTQAKSGKLVLCSVVVELIGWSHLQEKRKSELIVVTTCATGAPRLRIEPFNYLVVNLGRNQDDSRLNECSHCKLVSMVIWRLVEEHAGFDDINVTALNVFHEAQFFVSGDVVTAPDRTTWGHINRHDDLDQRVVIFFDIIVSF
jgi:hypothetical protein